MSEMKKYARRRAVTLWQEFRTEYVRLLRSLDVFGVRMSARDRIMTVIVTSASLTLA